jgi:hypothetical protein
VPTVPVVDVAVTKQGSLMASGDVHGRVFLRPGWRWIGVAMLPKDENSEPNCEVMES